MSDVLIRIPRSLQVVNSNGKRYVRCEACGELVERTIVTHLKKVHPALWQEYISEFSRLRQRGHSYQEIMWHFGRAFSWTVVERALAEAGVLFSPKGRVGGPLEPKDFSLETTTVWSFPSRGKWAVHDSNYRGNWAPEVPRNLIMRFSRPGDWVLDPFVGGGTTSIEAAILSRNFVGFDISMAAVELARRKLRSLKARIKKEKRRVWPVVRIHRGDARRMAEVPDGTIQLACVHPPYLDIIEYTRRNPADLSTITDPDRFIRELRKTAMEIFRCLRPGGVMALLMGDVRKNGKIIPLGMRTLEVLMELLDIEDVVIKTQHNTSKAYFWKTNSFLRIAHEYLFIMRKPRSQLGL